MHSLDARECSSEQLLELAEAALARGEVVAFPTDTVYGILCRPDRPEAIAAIYAAKGRSSEKPLIVLLASVDELLAYGHVTDRLTRSAARAFLPGALTMIVQRPEHIPEAVTGGRDSIGLRVPEHPLLQALLTRTGPLASTSANLSGAPAYEGIGQLEVPGVDLFVHAGPTQRRRESSVVNFMCSPPEVLREGALAKATVATWLGNLDVV